MPDKLILHGRSSLEMQDRSIWLKKNVVGIVIVWLQVLVGQDQFFVPGTIRVQPRQIESQRPIRIPSVAGDKNPAVRQET